MIPVTSPFLSGKYSQAQIIGMKYVIPAPIPPNMPKLQTNAIMDFVKLETKMPVTVIPPPSAMILL
jgi:hypothetical protein